MMIRYHQNPRLYLILSILATLISTVFSEISLIEDDDFFTSTIIPKPDLQLLCINFLECESEMMNIHKKCTAESRKATGEACGLMDDFKQLNKLMEARVNEFGNCVGNETAILENDPDRVDALELPYSTCEAVRIDEMEAMMIKDGCWKVLAVVKQKCKKIEKCCPAAKICMKSGRNSDATREVREKHIEINRKTLECRNEMKKILDNDHKHGNSLSSMMKARAHAVLTSGADTVMDSINKKYAFTKNERHILKAMKKGLNISTSQLTVTLPPPGKAVHMQDKVVQKLVYTNNRKPKTKKVSKTSIAPVTTPRRTFKITVKPSIQSSPAPKLFHIKNQEPKMSKLKQFEEFETMLEKLETVNNTTIAPRTKIRTSKKPNLQRLGRKGISTQKPRGGIFPAAASMSHNAKNKGLIPKLEAKSQPQSFALPSNVNLTKMQVLDARPFLRPQVRQSSKILNILGMPVISSRPRIQSIQTKNDFDKPIMKSFKIEQDLVPFNDAPEAFVASDGQWTVMPMTSATMTPELATTIETKAVTVEAENNPTTKNKVYGQRQEEVKDAMETKKTKQELVIFKKPSTLEEATEFTTTETLPFDTEILEAMLRTTMKSPEQQDSSPSKPVIDSLDPHPPKMTMTRRDEAEMMIVKEDLIKNLEAFVQNNKKATMKKVKLTEEVNRLELLRTTREEYEKENAPMDYCRLYSICSEELKFVTKTCESTNGRLIPGLPRRRFGECNRKLVNQYKRMESMKHKVEALFDKCLAERIASQESLPLETCSSNWPLMPEFEQETACIHRVRIVQNHCAKLSRCCGAAQECRLIIDETPQARKLIEKEEAVARASAKCQIKAYNDYNKYKTKKFGTVRGGTTRAPITTTTTTVVPKIKKMEAKPAPPERIFPTFIHIGEYQPKPKSMQIDDGKLDNLRRIDTGSIKMLWDQ